MDETKLTRYLLISVLSVLVLAFALTLTNVSKGYSTEINTRDAACFSA